KRALAASEEIGDPHGRAMTLHHFARLHVEVGQYDQAEEYLRESLRLSKTYNMRNLNNLNYILMGTLLRERRDIAKAEGNLFRALTAYSKQGNRWGLCTVLLEIVEVHRLRKNFPEAMAMAEEAQRYASDLDINYLRALSLLAKARLIRDTGERNPETLLKILNEALAHASKVENPETPGRIFSEMAEVLVRARRLQEARQHFTSAAEKFRAVLDRLPKEFRATYQEKHKDKFLGAGTLSGVESAPPAQAEAPAPARAAPKPVRPSDPLEHVNELMKILAALPHLGEFLNQLVARLVDLSGAETGLVL